MSRRIMRLAICSGFLLASAVCLAQGWEAGGAAGAGLSRGFAVTNGSAKARLGFRTGPVFGVYIGQDIRPNLGGEIRYLFRTGPMRLTSGDTKASLGARSHLIYYDVLFYSKPAGVRFRPFVALGAGARVFQGSGQENTYQPLWQFVLLTKTSQSKPLFSAGAGIKAIWGKRMLFRVEFRDYMSPFPDQIFDRSPGSKAGGWLHELTPQVGVSYTF
jgi:hypothetical protein